MFSMPAVFQTAPFTINPYAQSLWGKLMYWFPLDDTTLTLNSVITESFSNNTNLKVNGTSTGLTSVAGVKNTAISANGAASAISGSSGFPNPASTTSVGLTTWIKYSSSTSTQVCAMIGYAGEGFNLRALSGILTCSPYISGYKNLSWGSASNDNNWHLVSIGYDGSNMYLSVDNSAYITAAQTGNIIWGGTGLGLFSISGNASKFTGSLDEAFFTQSPLTQAELNYIWNGGSGKSFSQVKAESGH